MAEIGDVARSTVEGARQQFQEQIDFLRRKLNLPSETWRDIQRAAHDRAFVVAGATKADLLYDLRKAVDQAVQGGSIGEFRKGFAEIVAKHGWTGWTGEGSKAGEAWRTRVIYQTNLMTSYAAGRRAQLLDPDLVKRRPFWRYVHNDSVTHPRPHHKQWGDMRLTLRHDHPFWETHFPPNGWGCKCRVVAVAAPGDGDATTPPDGWDAIDPRTGTPAGIDEGWDYAPGARADDDLRSFVQEKLIDYPPAISAALSRDVNRYINAEQAVPDFVRQVLTDGQRADPLWLGFVERPDWIAQAVGVDAKGYTVLLPADAPRHVQASHGFDGGGQRPAQPEDFARLESVLNDPDALRAGDLLLQDNLVRNRWQRARAASGVQLGLQRHTFARGPGCKASIRALVFLLVQEYRGAPVQVAIAIEQGQIDTGVAPDAHDGGRQGLIIAVERIGGGRKEVNYAADGWFDHGEWVKDQRGTRPPAIGAIGTSALSAWTWAGGRSGIPRRSRSSRRACSPETTCNPTYGAHHGQIPL